jgi:hypothetical protein
MMWRSEFFPPFVYFLRQPSLDVDFGTGTCRRRKEREERGESQSQKCRDPSHLRVKAGC